MNERILEAIGTACFRVVDEWNGTEEGGRQVEKEETREGKHIVL